MKVESERRRRHEIYERTKIESAGKTLQSSLFLSSFSSGLLSGQTTSMNRRGTAKEKVFPLWRARTLFGIGAERRQSEIRAENKGNKKSQKKSTDNISESLRSLARPSKKREGGDLSRTFFSLAKLSLRKGTLCFPDDDKSHLPFLKKALFLFLARRARPDVMTAP